MTREQGKAVVIDLQAVRERDADFIRAAMRAVVQWECPEPGERTGGGLDSGEIVDQ